MLKEVFKDDYEVLIKENAISKTEILVKKMFEDKKCKSGEPYVDHLNYVSSKQETDEGKVVGLLHDLLEDTSITSSDLVELGYDSRIIDAVLLLTRDKSKYTYDEYINNLLASKNNLAILVKKADLENNMDLNRFKEPSLKDYDRVEKKYKPQYEKILIYLGEIK